MSAALEHAPRPWRLIATYKEGTTPWRFFANRSSWQWGAYATEAEAEKARALCDNKAGGLYRMEIKYEPGKSHQARKGKT